MSKNKYYVEALSRGLQILEIFSEESPTLSLTEIASSVGLEKSTAFRFVHTLEKLGYLERNPVTKQYRPGLKVLRLGFAALNGLETAEIARPYLKALSAECGETTNMTIRDGSEIVYVVRIKTRQIIAANLHVGSRLPVHCTCMGKSQLVDFSRQELCELLGEGPYRKMGPNTVTTLDALVVELGRVREQGYAINDEELAVGLRAVAAPIWGRDGEVVAAVNVSVPTARASRLELEQVLAPKVMRTAHEISLALGADV